MDKHIPKTLTVHILDREYRVACPDGAETALEQAARFLDHKMVEIRDSRKVLGIERIAVMSALNLTHDLLNQRPVDSPEASGAVADMMARIDAALQRHKSNA
jgi:cell division protein ZapA